MKEMLRIGTCSWKYDSWVGLVYSDRDKANYLKEYAVKYNTVEVDQWFWSLFDNVKPRLPDPAVVEDYLDSVPGNFTFSIKVPNSITLTHYYPKTKGAPLKANPHFLSVELFREFLERIAPLKGNLGPLMFQFEYLNRQKMSCQAEFQDKFSAFISACPGGFDYALEIRNPNYFNQGFFDFLNQHSLHQVFVQGYYLPPIIDIYRKYPDYIKDLTVVRLMGPDRKGIEQKTGDCWDRIVDSRDEELAAIVTMVRDLEERGIRVYLNVNNHYEGSAPLTIQKISHMIAALYP